MMKLITNVRPSFAQHASHHNGRAVLGLFVKLLQIGAFALSSVR